ncbi:MAG: MoxR family ATPase, partial [Eubacterium sp.]|nr:MoxR family ATPase [Eubacterium sp.]
ELNRTSPKTQSALLEVMEERQASVEGVTRKLPNPFVVIATQNPTGASGTQSLPDSQLDRFMICVSMGYPAHQDAVALLKGEVWNKISDLEAVLSKETLLGVQKQVAEIFVHDDLYDYMVSLVEKTRDHELFSQGASPRGTIALLRMSRAMAFLEGRDFVTAEDVQNVAAEVLGHRVKLSPYALAESKSPADCIRVVLGQVNSPRMGRMN